HQLRIVRDLAGDWEAQVRLHTLLVELRVRVGLVQEENDAVRRNRQGVQNFEGQLGVLDRRNAERGDDRDPIGVVQDLQVDLTQMGAAVDDEVVEHLAELAENAAHVVDGDQVRQLRADRGQQHLDAVGAVDHDLPDEVRIHVVDVFDQVGNALGVVEVQQYADVAELQVEIDQGDLPLGLVRHGDGQVGRDQGLAHAAFAGIEEEDLSMLPAARGLAVGGGRGRGGRCAGRFGEEGFLLLFELVDAPDTGDQLVTREGLDQELAGPRLHSPPQVVPLALDRHDDDRGPGRLLGQHLGRLDAVHDRHVDVHQDQVRGDLLRLLDALLAIDGGGDDLDVGLEGEQLLEIVQRAGDVVHDQDFDWLAHLVISLKKAP